jgi:hypothetical protein
MANHVRSGNSGLAPSGPRRMSPHLEKIRQRAQIRKPDAARTYNHPKKSRRAV